MFVPTGFNGIPFIIEKICVCVYIRPFLIVKMKSLVVSSAGLYCMGCTGEGESSLELVL